MDDENMNMIKFKTILGMLLIISIMSIVVEPASASPLDTIGTNLQNVVSWFNHLFTFTGINKGTIAGVVITDTLPQNRLTTGTIADNTVPYGGVGIDYLPIIGDWNGDGKDTLGVYQISTGTFFLSNNITPGPADLTVQYGYTGNIYPVSGKWNGGKTSGIGIYDRSTGGFYLKNNITAGDADYTFTFGSGLNNQRPVTGDWNGDGKTEIGIYDITTTTVYLRNSLSSGAADTTFTYGSNSWIPIAGHWTNSIDTIGAFDPSTATFYLKNSNSAGNADYTIQFGINGDMPIVGDWTASGHTLLGLYRQSTGTFYFSNTPVSSSGTMPVPSPTPTPTVTSTPIPTPVPTITPPPSVKPRTSFNDWIASQWVWISNLFGFNLLSGSIIGTTGIIAGSGTQTYNINMVSPELADSIYNDGAASELYGDWGVVNSKKEVVAQKGSYQKLTGNTYTDVATVVFPDVAEQYSVIGIIIKVSSVHNPDNTWTADSGVVIAKEGLGIKVNLSIPPSVEPKTGFIEWVLSGDAWNWIKSIVGWK